METTRTRTRRPRSRPLALDDGAGHGSRSAQTAGSRAPGRLTADLVAIGLALTGALLGLDLFRHGAAGLVGGLLQQFLRLWMGEAANVAPVLFLGAALLLVLDYRRATNPQMLLGIGGFLVVLFGWMHLMSTESYQEIWDSTGARFFALIGRQRLEELLREPDGGLFGAAIMSLMSPLGRSGSYVTLVAVGVASLLLISELTLRGIFERIHERSRIAAAGARRSATAVREKARSVASILPVRRREAALELGDEVDEPARRVVERRGIRRLGPGLASDDEEEEEAAGQGLAPVLLPERVIPRTLSEPEVPAHPDARAPASKARVRLPKPAQTSGDFTLPPLELLDTPAPRPKRPAGEVDANIPILENTLAQFKIEAQVVEIADGPSITRYEIRLGEGIRVKKILDLADNLAMSLAAMSVRVEAPIPGKAAIGIEVPKKQASVVTLKECLESPEFRDFKSFVSFVLGKDVAGNVRCADLSRMPHLLVAGATNSGKSSCLNALIASMLFRAKPDELKMIMIDPKRVELTLYDGIPHLIHPVVKDVKQAAGILRWVLKEMERRYDLFAQLMTRNIENYNEKVAKEPEKRLPFLVVVIDELADLMMQQGPEVEQSICRLAQLARATGIHLVIATQRPSVDVITGLIKANVPSRIAFSVSSQIDSRTILDAKGAESLIGRGDMLFKPVDATKPLRIQGAYLRESEVEAIVNHLKAQGRPEYIAESISVDHGAYGTASEEESEDDMFEPAARFVVTTGHASTSMIQRKFKIGYTRAARLVDMMEARGIVGALDGAKPREILMSRDSLDQMFLGARDSLFRGDRGGLANAGEGGSDDESDDPESEG